MFPGMLSGVRILIRKASPQGKPLYFVTVGGRAPFHRALHTGVLSATGIFSLPARLLHLDLTITRSIISGSILVNTWSNMNKKQMSDHKGKKTVLLKLYSERRMNNIRNIR